MKVEPIVLEGGGVRLEPLTLEHHDELVSVVRDGNLWGIRETLVPRPEGIHGFVETATRRQAARTELPFVIRNVLNERIVGSTRFMCINTDNKRLEIGFTFLALSAQRTHVNTAAKYLLLKHAFDTWNVNRVELITDVLNGRSRTAIERIGGKQEGILRQHMVMPDGRIRDSVLYSIVHPDWPDTQAALEQRMSERPSTK